MSKEIQSIDNLTDDIISIDESLDEIINCIARAYINCDPALQTTVGHILNDLHQIQGQIQICSKLASRALYSATLAF